MLQYIIGFVTGVLSTLLLFGSFINVETAWVNLIVGILLNVGAILWCHKHHKNKQEKYYNRFKKSL